MLVAIPIASASQRWLEEPIRRGRLVGLVPRRNLALAGALTIALAATSLALRDLTTERLAAATAGGPAVSEGSVEPLPELGGLATTHAPDFSPGPGTSPPADEPQRTFPRPPGGPVPAGLIPSLDLARDDIPAIYDNGCHLSQQASTIPPCVFGARDASTAVVLFGDSHAAQWFPALEQLAIERSWRLVSLTKSGCTPASITVWNSGLKRASTECDEWRDRVLDRVAAERPALVIVASSHPYPSAGVDGPTPADGGVAMAAGLRAILAALVPLSESVALIADTPKFELDPPDCLSAHLDDTLACAEPRGEMVDLAWLETEATIARDLGLAFVDPTDWACPTDPCPTIVGRYLVYRDRHHLATHYVIALRERLVAELPSLDGR
jgi:hypothetical protein